MISPIIIINARIYDSIPHPKLKLITAIIDIAKLNHIFSNIDDVTFFTFAVNSFNFTTNLKPTTLKD